MFAKLQTGKQLLAAARQTFTDFSESFAEFQEFGEE